MTVRERKLNLFSDIPTRGTRVSAYSLILGTLRLFHPDPCLQRANHGRARSLAQVLNAPLPENLERELIIVDDCSTDGTSEILDRLAAAEPCIRLFRKAKNEGRAAPPYAPQYAKLKAISASGSTRMPI